MCCHTAVTKAVVSAACALAIALSTLGMGANSSWAGSDQASPVQFAALNQLPTDKVTAVSKKRLRVADSTCTSGDGQVTRTCPLESSPGSTMCCSYHATVTCHVPTNPC
jgi:hypothetical protein